MNLHNNQELSDLLDLNAVKSRTRFPNSIIESSSRHPPMPMLRSTIPYSSIPSETIYSNTDKDYWNTCPSSSTTYNDGIYDGTHSNRDILHPFITTEPLNNISSNLTSRSTTNDISYSGL
ncbi:unnamed protein product [Adineta steineri]|uniref:Uncharacterized protein n=1 Tax=Adineta steineri TaxID=433720 RepID=A0A815SWQ1_9BILA|nr:unnamed protein product [Adineta steineri]CAF1642864.1 unnamed protein product [Adineta steineri]